MSNKEFADLNFNNINILNQAWDKGSSFSYETNGRPNFGICFILSGEITYKTAKGNFFAETADAVILDKDALYRANFNKNATHNILINFDCDMSAALRKFIYSKSGISILKKRADLRNEFLEILNYYVMPGRECMVKSKLYCILDGICNFEPKDLTAVKIKNIISSDIEFKLRESEIALKCSVSVSTLQRIFKKEYGKSVSEYRNELRIAKAKNLLISRKYSINDIAELLGFCDCGHFSKFFKKQEGISPMQYLKQYYIM